MSLAALPIPLITNAQIQFVNLPNITDVNIESEINNHLGIVSFKRNKYTTFINGNLYKYIVPKNLGSKLRSSLYYLGALLSRFGKAITPFPGGCNYNNRNFDIHIQALKYMGAEIIVKNNLIVAEKNKMSAKHIFLPIPSKGVTINLIYSSLRLNGVTVIENANTAPEVAFLVCALKSIGFDIFMDKSIIVIYGNSDYKHSDLITLELPYDRVETVTYSVLALLTHKETKICNFNYNLMKDIIMLFNSMGVNYSYTNDKLIIHKNQLLKPTILKLGFPPSIDSDFGPVITPLLCLTKGQSLIIDGHNTHRIGNLLHQLSSIGAKYKFLNENIFLIDGIDEFCGNCSLFGEDIRSTMGAALAAIVCKGNVKVFGLEHINRAYDNFLGKIYTAGFELNIV